MQSPSLLSAHHISKHFGGNGVLHDVSVVLAPGEIVTLIGPNGSGKSTLLKILLGLLPPDSGTVTRREKLRIGYMPQKLVVDHTLPLTVGWFLSLYSSTNDTAQVMQELGITQLAAQSLHDLSGGEMQRVMLARALLCNPELLVLDEPVQGVDINGQAELYDLISRVSLARNCAVLMVSHDLHLVMAATQRVICLNHHICCEGHPHQVQSDPAFVNLFGKHVADSLAVYTHHHDHTHDMHGEPHG